MEILLKNDKKYFVNGKEAVFMASQKKAILGYNPLAVFTFDNGDTIEVEYSMMNMTYSVVDDKFIDIELKYSVGSWKIIVIRDN